MTRNRRKKQNDPVPNAVKSPSPSPPYPVVLITRIPALDQAAAALSNNNTPTPSPWKSCYVCGQVTQIAHLYPKQVEVALLKTQKDLEGMETCASCLKQVYDHTPQTGSSSPDTATIMGRIIALKNGNGKVPKEEEEQGDGQFIQVKEENVGEDSAHEVEDPHFVGIKQELLWNEDEYEDAVNFGELGLETNTVKMEESLLEEHPITDAESEAELNHEETPVSDQCINLVQLNINYSTIPTILNIETDTVSGESLPNPDNRFSCSLCDKTFKNSQHVQRHIRSHTGWKPFSCDVCKESFALNHHLQRHKRIHTGEKPHKCSLCTKEFAEGHNLKRHMIYVHDGPTPNVCTICDRKFAENSLLKKHHTKVHNGL